MLSVADNPKDTRTSSAQLGCSIGHDRGGAKLALFYVDDAASFGSRNEQVCLAAQECRDLNNVCDLADCYCLVRLMNVGNDGHPKAALDCGQHPGYVVCAEYNTARWTQ